VGLDKSAISSNVTSLKLAIHQNSVRGTKISPTFHEGGFGEYYKMI
jgi:hypothetical protein